MRTNEEDVERFFKKAKKLAFEYKFGDTCKELDKFLFFCEHQVLTTTRQVS